MTEVPEQMPAVRSQMGPDDEAPRPSGGLEQVFEHRMGHRLSVWPEDSGERGTCECGWSESAATVMDVVAVHSRHVDTPG